MVFITLKLTVSKKINFLLYCFCFFLYNCYQTFLWTGRICFLVIYKLFCLVLGLSDGILTLLLNLVSKRDTNVLM